METVSHDEISHYEAMAKDCFRLADECEEEAKAEKLRVQGREYAAMANLLKRRTSPSIAPK